uniref:Uncharacterized protein n=1 Tax=Peronospora matthiolae TaxID=2874970 RepID=A0AAV1UR23_9STRA
MDAKWILLAYPVCIVAQSLTGMCARQLKTQMVNNIKNYTMKVTKAK